MIEYIAISLLLICIISFLYNGGQNWIMLLILLELILLSLALLFLNTSYLLDDALGALIAIVILPLAGAESSLGLALLIRLKNKRGTLKI